VPFTADTTIGTLMARVDQPLEVPDELGPLRPLLEEAGRLDHDQRLDAAGLGRALVAAAEQLPRPAALPLTGTAPSPSGGAPVDGRDATLMPGSVLAPGAAAADGVPPPPGPPGPGGPGPVAAAGNGAPGDHTAVLTAPVPVTDPSMSPGLGAPGGNGAPPVIPLAAGARRRRGWVLPLVLVAAVALGVVGALLVQRSSVPSHTVPQALIGSQQGDLPEYVGEYGWRIETDEARRDGTEPGEILQTDPEAGSELREGETLTVTVSLGPTLVDVPQDLVGLTEDEAEDRLRQEAPALTPEFVGEASEEVDEGEVIRLGDDVGEQMPKGSTVEIVVSSGPPRPTVPDVIGWSYDDAAAELEQLGLSVERSVDAEAEGDFDEVVSTDPEEGDEVDDDETVTVTVAGAGGAEVPDDLVGMSRRDAEEAIEDAGLEVGQIIGPRRDAEVIGSWPIPGQVVAPDSSVQLFTRARDE
jgi:beta-lactam-binding protein with PASTA domain